MTIPRSFIKCISFSDPLFLNNEAIPDILPLAQVPETSADCLSESISNEKEGALTIFDFSMPILVL
ncbi:hypothetical protein MICAK_2110003 [Microcystis aeruginosa PCC 9701]|uniref:Uncharacterized protein n=1 Tax=Microcystis aeruginosa PCC 9701 TaxID=721123 RepID=I4INU0_MICAE|nr:hypothetical protein MICAK_2110003 [Microcystis aeruginosa PCC 9701]